MKYHFISIGGSIMHNLAVAMHLQGHTVSGSDDEIFEPAKSNLAKYGLLPDSIGWNPKRITPDLDAVVLGMHAKEDNPELVRAKQLGIKIVSFPEFIYENSKNKKRVVISGSHGKTTITSMILHVLKTLGINADYLVGAQIPGFDVMVKITKEANLLVVEGDEYLTSTLDPRPKIHLYHPNIALTTGIAWDHFNVFPTFPIYVEQFKKFVDLIEPEGCFIYFKDDPELQTIASNAKKNISIISYDTPDYYVENGVFILNYNGKKYPTKLAGRHNMQNIMGAMTVCSQLGINDIDFLNAISTFVGAAKRLEIIAKKNNLLVYRDFAHAPSKVTATVNAIKEQYPSKKIVAVFELHTYSSLNINFINQYQGTLTNADKKIVFFDPEAIKLKRLPMLNCDDVKNAFNDDNISVCNDVDTLTSEVKSNIKEDCVLLLMSSGDFGGIDWQKLLNL